MICLFLLWTRPGWELSLQNCFQNVVWQILISAWFVLTCAVELWNSSWSDLLEAINMFAFSNNSNSTAFEANWLENVRFLSKTLPNNIEFDSIKQQIKSERVTLKLAPRATVSLKVSLIHSNFGRVAVGVGFLSHLSLNVYSNLMHFFVILKANINKAVNITQKLAKNALISKIYRR